MWENMLEPYRTQMTIWRMQLTCWINKAEGTHSEYVILLLFHCNNGFTNALDVTLYPVHACLVSIYVYVGQEMLIFAVVLLVVVHWQVIIVI
jgi:hypothetical protein